MSFGEIIEYGTDLSVSKLLSMVDQSLFDCLGSCQDHHLLRSKVDCEHWSILLGELKRWKKNLQYFAYASYISTKKTKAMKRIKQHVSHINKRAVESLEIHLKQVTNQGKRFRSWRLVLLVFGAEAGVKKVEDQQAHSGHQQRACDGGLEKIFQHDPAVTWAQLNYLFSEHQI